MESVKFFAKIHFFKRSGGFQAAALVFIFIAQSVFALSLAEEPVAAPAQKAAVKPASPREYPAAEKPAEEKKPEKSASDTPPLTAPQYPDTPAGDAARAYAAGDLTKAREIWEKLAAEGDGQAMNNLGVLYDQGQASERDAGRALRWFAEAANAGDPAGMNNYARLLEQGKGIPANPEEAARWFDLAARKGQPEAQYNIGYLYENGRGVPRDEAAAAAWYSRASSLRQKDAMARLGHMYRVGKGVEKNAAKATLLLYAAAMEGSRQAIEELKNTAKEGSPEATLFGQKLDSTTRKAMRESLKKSGAKIKSEDDDRICDVYDTSGVVPGANEMAVCYAPDGRLGFLKIDYPANDKARADAILDMVKKRFGEPSASENPDSNLWNLGSVIVATQHAPTHGQMSLMYMAPEVYYQTKAD